MVLLDQLSPEEGDLPFRGVAKVQSCSFAVLECIQFVVVLDTKELSVSLATT
jgi:hypothetical protein